MADVEVLKMGLQMCNACVQLCTMLKQMQPIRKKKRKRKTVKEQGQQTVQHIQNLILISGSLNDEKKHPRCWMKTQSTKWWEDTVMNHFFPEDFLENFRLSKQTFYELCEYVKEDMMPDDNLVREPIEFRKRVAIAVFTLASCCEYRVIANLFAVHKSSVMCCIYSFCEAICKKLPVFIKMPDEHEAMEIARRFEIKTKFPQVFGVVDGTHIPITPPKEGFRDFINRKRWASYILQGLVNDRFLFRNISCKMPGCAHDAAAFRESNLYKQSCDLPKGSKVIDGVTIPLLVLGDPAYPLIPWLMKGFTGAHLSPEKESFNVYHSCTRQVVEIAFGRLKARWRRLQKRSDIHHAFVPNVIATCCALHNLCDMNDLKPTGCMRLTGMGPVLNNHSICNAIKMEQMRAEYAMHSLIICPGFH